MILPFLLFTFITQIQASQHLPTPPSHFSKMSLPELQIHEMLIKNDISQENKRWQQEKVCCGISRETIGTSCTCCAASTFLVAGACLGPQYASIINPCIDASTKLISWFYQPNQQAKETELQEIRTQIKLKTE